MKQLDKLEFIEQIENPVLRFCAINILILRLHVFVFCVGSDLYSANNLLKHGKTGTMQYSAEWAIRSLPVHTWHTWFEKYPILLQLVVASNRYPL